MKEVTFRDFARMCRYYTKSVDGCNTCPLSSQNNGYKTYCPALQINHTDKAEEIISKWCEEHPVKTYIQDFLSRFPDRFISEDDTVKELVYDTLCVETLYGHKNKCSSCKDYLSCRECWNSEYEEGE